MKQANQSKPSSFIKFEDEEKEQERQSHERKSQSHSLVQQNGIHRDKTAQRVGQVQQDNDDFSRQDVSFEIYSNEEERKQKVEDKKEKEELEREEEKKQRISKWVSFVFGVLPILIMIGIFLLFSFDDNIKKRVVNMFENIHSLNFEISFYIIIYGMLLIFLSFPYLIFEMSLGFTFSFPVATFFAVFAKLLGEIVCFTLSRYVFKNCCLQFLRMNEYFIVLERAVKKYPWLVSNLLRASILVPLFVVNFGSGIINLSLTQYLVPAFLWGAVYSMFMVICGSQLMNIKEVLENATYPKNRLLFFFELGMLIVSLLLMIAIIWKSGKMYEDIKAEMQEQMMLEKQLQSTRAQESMTIINVRAIKQNSASITENEADDHDEEEEEERSKQNLKGQQNRNNSFNAFQMEGNNNLNKQQDIYKSQLLMQQQTQQQQGLNKI